MNRITILLLFVILLTAAGCSTPAPTTPAPLDFVPLAPTETKPAVVTATMPPEPTAPPPGQKATRTPEPTQPDAPAMPPLNSGGVQRVGDAWLPFTFELPENWNTPEGARLYWVPAGVPLEMSTARIFAVTPLVNLEPVDSDFMPGNYAVESREEIVVNGATYSKILVKVFNGPGGTESAYQTYVIVPIASANKAFAFSVSAPDEPGRAALDPILMHALLTMQMNP